MKLFGKILYPVIPLLMLLIMALPLLAVEETATYQIMKLNTPSITIGGKSLKVGDRFSGTSNIKWNDDKQMMEVKDVGKGAIFRFSKKVMNSKGSALSLADFFLRTNKASSRVAGASPFKLRQSDVASQFPEKRIALVIGNSNYYNLNYLKNAQKDASDVADALLSLGFDVLEAYETNYDEMRSALNRFSGLARDYDVALFYFAGHGLQEDGKNYLIPINAELEFRSELSRFLQADDVLERIDASGAPTKLIFIDACRNAKTTWSRGTTEGLARMEGSPGAVIVFSTESGKVALDGDGDNSPFAASLLNNLSANALFLETMNNVVLETYDATDHKQYPLIIGSPLTKFNFNPGVSATTVKRPERDRKASVNPPRVAVGPVSTPSPVSYDSSAELMDKAKQLIRKLKADQAVPYLKEAALNGNAEANYLLGDLYYNGNGVSKSFSTAKSYFRLAAEAGLAEAQYMMGVMARNGQGGDKNFREAQSWLEKAASQGHEKARNMLQKL